MSESNFNRVAPVYDFLAQLVFGLQLKKAQTIFLSHIQDWDKVLVVGGGTGWILEELNQLGKPLTIVYVESSFKMMALSKARKGLKNLKIEYIQQPLLEIEIVEKFDVVCTFFFLDLFEKEMVLESIDKIKQLLNFSSKWLFADFVLNNQSSISQKILVKTMILFFRVCATIQSNKLLDYQQMIAEKGFKTVENRQWKKGLIHSTVFCKT